MTQSKSRAAGGNLKALMSEDKDFLQEIVREAMQQILEAEMTDVLAAEPGERTEARLGYRAGHYPRTLITRVGKLELRVPRDRDGRFSNRALRTVSALGEGSRLCACGDVCPRGLHPQGESHHRGTLRSGASPLRPSARSTRAWMRARASSPPGAWRSPAHTLSSMPVTNGCGKVGSSARKPSSSPSASTRRDTGRSWGWNSQAGRAR